MKPPSGPQTCLNAARRERELQLRAAVEREGALTAVDILDIRTRLGLVPAWREAALSFADDYAIASSRATISSA
jgi:hypothetical protein